MTRILLLSLLILAGNTLVTADDAATSTKDLEASVVKVYVSANPPDLLSPWQKAGVELATGSGVVITGGRVLTNAHVVEDAVSIELKRSNSGQRYVAEVAFIDHERDLAMLTVADDAFDEGVRPIELGEMPGTQTVVEAYGFPVGGETLSVTSGIISRIEVSTYIHAMTNVLAAQIDAAINSGNSGGPVLAGDELVGIAVQFLDEAENVGYMIPVSVVRRFLRDLEDGRIDGLPTLGIMVQGMESPSLRQSLGMASQQTGTLITWVDHGSPASEVLQPRDVLLSIDGQPVANDMTVAWPRLGRLHFSEVVQSKQIGDPIEVEIMRDGHPLKKEIKLTPHKPLVPGRRRSDTPRYLAFGGVVFIPLAIDYLMYFEEIPYDLGDLALSRNRVTPERREVILVQRVLPHPVNRGYQAWEDRPVRAINGEVPRDMKHLSEIIDEAEGKYLTIATEDDSILTLDLEAARSAQASILQNFGIAHDRSPDLRAAGADERSGSRRSRQARAR
jgi:S1-C subfamily serine protease